MTFSRVEAAATRTVRFSPDVPSFASPSLASSSFEIAAGFATVYASLLVAVSPAPFVAVAVRT